VVKLNKHVGGRWRKESKFYAQIRTHAWTCR